MSIYASALAKREKGLELPLSIATAQALESLCGLGEFYTENPEVFKGDALWINLRTLFRNCHGSIERYSREQMQAEHFLDGLYDDVNIIQSTITQRTLGKMKVVFYICEFDSFKKTFPHAKYKELNTHKQIIEQRLEDVALKAYLDNEFESDQVDIRKFDSKITDRDKRTFMLTHYPADLLYRDHFQNLTLLESHTGKIKPRAEWYTKLTGGKRYERIPFNRMTLQVFGDSNLLFASMLPSIKNKILEIAEADKWTSVTTDERVKYSINKLYDPREKEFFLRLF